MEGEQGPQPEPEQESSSDKMNQLTLGLQNMPVGLRKSRRKTKRTVKYEPPVVVKKKIKRKKKKK